MTNYEYNSKVLMSIVDQASKILDNKNPSIDKIEAFARTFCGIAPALQVAWESNVEYVQILKRFIHCGIQHLAKSAPTDQLLVEAAYISLAFIRCPKAWHSLSFLSKQGILSFLEEAKSYNIRMNNWVLFPAMIETFLQVFEQAGNQNFVQLALMQIEDWYKGDSLYGDGRKLQVDYYNSYCIHPMILEIVLQWESKINFGVTIYKQRAVRYAEILEHMISPEGTFPIQGRSSAYGFAAFAHLSDMLRRSSDEIYLPFDVAAAQQGMTLCLKKMQLMNFETEEYISAGSHFICAMSFAHLAIPQSKDQQHQVWSTEPSAWTQKKYWNGHKIKEVNRSIFV
jgi:hypothetical protein